MPAKDQILAKPRSVQQIIHVLMTRFGLDAGGVVTHFDQLAEEALVYWADVCEKCKGLDLSEVQIAELLIFKLRAEPTHGWAEILRKRKGMSDKPLLTLAELEREMNHRAERVMQLEEEVERLRVDLRRQLNKQAEELRGKKPAHSYTFTGGVATGRMFTMQDSIQLLLTNVIQRLNEQDAEVARLKSENAMLRSRSYTNDAGL